MRNKITPALTIVAVLSGGAVFGIKTYREYRYNLQEQEYRKGNPYYMPGTVWTNTLVDRVGTDLILLDNGQYSSVSVCHVCGGKPEISGTWTRHSSSVQLVSSKSNAHYKLNKIRRENCEFLTDATEGREHHPVFYIRGRRDCERILLDDFDKEFENNESKSSARKP